MKNIFYYVSLLAFFTSLSYSQTYDIYVSDAGNFNNPPWQILKFDSTGQNPEVFIDNNLNWPQDILFMEDSNIVLISNLGSGRITRHNAITGDFISDFATGISGPTRIKIGPDNLLYVLQWSGNGRVKRYQLNGSYVDDFTSASVTQSIGIDWDANNNLYVSSYNGDLVRKFDTAGIDMGVFIGTNLVGPTNIWFENNGNLLVSDYDGGAIKRFDSNGNFISNFVTGLGASEGVAIYPNGNFLIGNGSTHSVKQYDSSGAYIQDIIPNGSGNLINPNAIVLRQVSPLDIEVNEESGSNFIYPSSGDVFYIKEDAVNELLSIEIYGITGKRIEKKTKSFNDTIRLSHLETGYYIVLATFKNWKTYTQKILVEH